MTEKEKTYRTLTDVLEAPAGESLATIAAVAAPIERITSGTGILKLFFNDAVATANDPDALAKLNPKQRAALQAKMVELGASVANTLLRSLSEYMPEFKQIIAAVNGITVAQLDIDYTGLEVVKMVRVMVSDTGFLSSVLTLSE